MHCIFSLFDELFSLIPAKGTLILAQQVLLLIWRCRLAIQSDMEGQNSYFEYINYVIILVLIGLDKN